MRKKIKVYAFILMVLVASTSTTLLWNFNSIFNNGELIRLEEVKHDNHHHLIMAVGKSQEQLYRFEVGYSVDLDNLVKDVESAGAMLNNLLKTEKHENLIKKLSQIERDFNVYTDLIKLISAASGPEDKKNRVRTSLKNASRIINNMEKLEELVRAILDDLEAENERLLNLSQLFLYIIVVSVIFGSLIIYIHFSMSVLKPFGSLIESVEEISRSGSLNIRASVPADADLALLAIKINDMLENLERWDEELKCNYEELKVTNEELQNSCTNLEEMTSELEEKSQELIEANHELKNLDNLKNDFMQNVSHELRTPLTPVMGYLELFLNNDLGELSPLQLEIIGDMYHCSKRLSFIIDTLLEMISLQEEERTEKFELLDPESIIQDIEFQIKEEAREKGLSLNIISQENLPQINGGRKKLVLMASHVLKNSIKFTQEGGKVDFSIKTRDRKFIEFVISDNGIGIEESMIKQIFKPFLQVDGSTTRGYEGIGLGLALVKKIVEIHKGKLDVESKEGEGTKVTIYLPVA